MISCANTANGMRRLYEGTDGHRGAAIGVQADLCGAGQTRGDTPPKTVRDRQVRSAN
jgi:hypothetical protein